MEINSMILSIISIIVSLGAVFVSIFSLKAQIKHNHQSVLPKIDFKAGDHDNSIYIKLINNGIGPAIIDKIDCFYDGTASLVNPTSNSLYGLLSDDNAITKDTIKLAEHEEIFSGYALLPGEIITLLDLKKDENNSFTAFRLMLKDTKLTVYYKDIYGENHKCETVFVLFGSVMKD